VPPTNEYTRLRQGRVPLSAPACPAIGSPAPSGAVTDIQTPLAVDQPAVCTFTTAGGTELHVENGVLSFGLAVPRRTPQEQLTMSIVLAGGTSPLQAALTIDVQAQQPRSVLIAPDQQTVYVVDEGKQSAASGLRGQLLRLNSNTQQVDRFFQVR
jgi:hypothetical protein